MVAAPLEFCVCLVGFAYGHQCIGQTSRQCWCSSACSRGTAPMPCVPCLGRAGRTDIRRKVAIDEGQAVSGACDTLLWPFPPSCAPPAEPCSPGPTLLCSCCILHSLLCLLCAALLCLEVPTFLWNDMTAQERLDRSKGSSDRHVCCLHLHGLLPVAACALTL